jgi:hypothetical protein
VDATLTGEQVARYRELQARLADLPEVKQVLAGEAGSVIWMLCGSAAKAAETRAAAAAALAAQGLTADDVEILPVVAAEALETTRVRLGRVERLPRNDGLVRIIVTLEWRGVELVEEVVAERGDGVELRAAASAALAALRRLTAGEVPVRLIGIKPVRAFDTDLIVVSVLRTGTPAQRYVGAVLADGDALRAAAMAVLDALNRPLEPYFVRTPVA